jgi:hypothetical protein
MPLKFIVKAEIDIGTGDLKIAAYIGDVPVTCVIKRSAVTAGLNELCISDTQALEIYHARSDEIQDIASQRFDNGERVPIVTRRDMYMH